MTDSLSDATIRVIDDDASMRLSLVDLLASVGLMARAFGSVDAFVAAEDEEVPGCCILDVRMPGRGGLEFFRNEKRPGARLPVIFISGHGDVAMAVAAMREGAVDFLSKPFGEQALLDAVNRALRIDRERRSSAQELAILRARFETLNDGERKVMHLVTLGYTNREIAANLGVSEITVKVRRGQVMRKMHAQSLPDLVRTMDRIAKVEFPCGSGIFP